jgi:hypothetical protein
MRSCIVVFVYYVVYVACVPCERKMMASSFIYIYIVTQSFTPGHHRVSIWIHIGSMTTTPKV